MIRKTLACLIFAFLLISCNNDDDGTLREQELQDLQETFLQIESMATSERCENATDWTFTAYGSKACGGPQGYIAYSVNINTEQFLSLVTQHQQAEAVYNEKWGVGSDCSFNIPPDGVSCENGDPIFIYDN